MDGVVLGKPRAIPALTGLRFVAAMLVYVSHMNFTPLHLPKVLTAISDAGYNGVTLFFVLSGFVICLNYYDAMRANAKRALVPFLIARFARIYPMYLLVLLWLASYTNVNQQVASSWHSIIDQLTLTQAWYPSPLRAFAYNPVAWSVSVEAFCYLVFPFIAVLILGRLRTIAQHLFVAGITVTVPLGVATYLSVTKQVAINGISHYVIYRLPAMRVADFMLGCLVARIYLLRADRPVGTREARFGAAALAIAVAICLVFMTMSRPAFVPFRFGPAYLIPFAIGIFCLARYSTIVSRALSTRIMVLLGAASYSFYLLHFYLLVLFHDEQVGLGTKTTLLHHATVFVLICAFSIGAFRCLEEPARRSIRRVYASRLRRPAATVAAAPIELDPVVVSGD